VRRATVGKPASYCFRSNRAETVVASPATMRMPRDQTA
jgi:hypothetical protein